MATGELWIPPDALDDPQAFELIRVWAAHGMQHVTIRSDLDGGAPAFGYMLAQLLEHAARLYAQREGQPIEQCRRQIVEAFEAELERPSGDASGEIPREH